jgi:hypothetical protein
LAEPLTGDGYGWFTPADLEVLFRVVNRLAAQTPVILIGGQALTTWVQYYRIDLPAFEGPYLTQDADFMGSGNIATLVADLLKGTARKPTFEDSTPNTATVVFVGASGEKILIDFLQSVLGIKDRDVTRLATRVAINDWDPIDVLHPLLVLQSRCINLHRLQEKRDTNGITQARVACLVVKKYLDECLMDPRRRKECFKAAKRIAELAKSSAGVFVWLEWRIDVLAVVEPDKMPGEFPRSWVFEITKVARKREIASRFLSPTRAALGASLDAGTHDQNERRRD